MRRASEIVARRSASCKVYFLLHDQLSHGAGDLEEGFSAHIMFRFLGVCCGDKGKGLYHYTRDSVRRWIISQKRRAGVVVGQPAPTELSKKQDQREREERTTYKGDVLPCVPSPLPIHGTLSSVVEGRNAL